MQRSYPVVPRVGVGAVIQRNDEIVLVKRGQEPAKGLWTIPGGMIKVGESIEDAVLREVFEECSLDIHIIKNIEIFEYFEHDDQGRLKYHYIILDYLANYKSGILKPGSDVTDAVWVHKNNLSSYQLTDSTLKLFSHIL